MKDIIDDIRDIVSELEDIGFKVYVEPSDDIRIKIASLRMNRTPFGIKVVRHRKDLPGIREPFNVNDIKEVFERIIEYSKSKDIHCDFFVSNPEPNRYFPNVHGSLPDIGNPNISWAKLNLLFDTNNSLL